MLRANRAARTSLVGTWFAGAIWLQQLTVPVLQTSDRPVGDATAATARVMTTRARENLNIFRFEGGAG